jgi:hypothetical protein
MGITEELFSDPGQRPGSKHLEQRIRKRAIREAKADVGRDEYAFVARALSLLASSPGWMERDGTAWKRDGSMSLAAVPCSGKATEVMVALYGDGEYPPNAQMSLDRIDSSDLESFIVELLKETSILREILIELRWLFAYCEGDLVSCYEDKELTLDYVSDAGIWLQASKRYMSPISGEITVPSEASIYLQGMEAREIVDSLKSCELRISDRNLHESRFSNEGMTSGILDHFLRKGWRKLTQTSVGLDAKIDQGEGRFAIVTRCRIRIENRRILVQDNKANQAWIDYLSMDPEEAALELEHGIPGILEMLERNSEVTRAFPNISSETMPEPETLVTKIHSPSLYDVTLTLRKDEPGFDAEGRSGSTKISLSNATAEQVTNAILGTLPKSLDEGLKMTGLRQNSPEVIEILVRDHRWTWISGYMAASSPSGKASVWLPSGSEWLVLGVETIKFRSNVCAEMKFLHTDPHVAALEIVEELDGMCELVRGSISPFFVEYGLSPEEASIELDTPGSLRAEINGIEFDVGFRVFLAASLPDADRISGWFCSIDGDGGQTGLRHVFSRAEAGALSKSIYEILELEQHLTEAAKADVSGMSDSLLQELRNLGWRSYIGIRTIVRSQDERLDVTASREGEVAISQPRGFLTIRADFLLDDDPKTCAGWLDRNAPRITQLLDALQPFDIRDNNASFALTGASSALVSNGDLYSFSYSLSKPRLISGWYAKLIKEHGRRIQFKNKMIKGFYQRMMNEIEGLD